MTFEWDESKRQANLTKHGIDFVDSQILWDGRATVVFLVQRSDEERLVTTGLIDDRFYSVIWTWRGMNTRIISARRAHANEERKYRSLFQRAA